MEKYGFIYIWYDRKHKRFYIGCHWGKEDDGYISSSSWMKKAYKYRPQDFKRKVISRIYTNRQDLLEEEHKWFQMIKPEELGKKYYNLRQHKWGHWSTDENKLLTVGQKISETQKGVAKPNVSIALTGRKLSEEHKENLRKPLKEEHIAKRKGRKFSEEHKEKMRLAHLGKKHSLETIEKMTGKKHSEETKEKIREKLMNNTNGKSNKGRIPANKGKKMKPYNYIKDDHQVR